MLKILAGQLSIYPCISSNNMFFDNESVETLLCTVRVRQYFVKQSIHFPNEGFVGDRLLHERTEPQELRSQSFGGYQPSGTILPPISYVLSNSRLIIVTGGKTRRLSLTHMCKKFSLPRSRLFRNKSQFNSQSIQSILSPSLPPSLSLSLSLILEVRSCLIKRWRKTFIE